MFDDETIAAIATPPGEGALAVVRISGPSAFEIAKSVFRSCRPWQTGMLRVGQIINRADELVDEVVLTAYRSPSSYTGEDVIEISGHGGPVVSASVLQSVLEAGARAAGPGEFTQRAFLNGKLDLTQAEAVMDLIRAQTPLAAKAAALQLEGRIGDEARAIAEEILMVVAHLEAYIDFPDEDIDPDVGQAMLDRVANVQSRVKQLLATAPEGRILREGVRLTICGKPNAGKSSLLNRLAGFDRAIVSPIAGTTRDTIEESVSLRGIPFRVIDTAGLRDSPDAIEREGVSRARQAIESADVVVHLIDGNESPESAAPPAERADEILVINKADLIPTQKSDSTAQFISCLTGTGIEDLVDTLVSRVMQGHVPTGTSHAAINARHQACLLRASEALEAAANAMASNLAPEFIAVELRLAMDSVGEITGRMDTEDILDRIFGAFCIGK